MKQLKINKYSLILRISAYLLLISLLTMLFVKCNTKKRITFRSKEYYDTAANNTERLWRLICGLKVQYAKRGNGEVTKWLVNDDKDSVLTYTVPLENVVDRYGYWYYKTQFMSHLPHEPLISTYAKLTRVDRDTIIEEFYNPKEIISPIRLAKEGQKVFRELDLKALEKSSTAIRYIKKSNTEFNGESTVYETPHPTLKKVNMKSYHEVGIDRIVKKTIFRPKGDKGEFKPGPSAYFFSLDPINDPLIKAMANFEE